MNRVRTEPIDIAVLGSTGSIGTQTLDVIRQNRDHFRVVGLAAHSNVELLAAQIKEFQPEIVAIGTEEAARELAPVSDRHTSIVVGDAGLDEVASHSSTRAVVAAVVGFSGLRSVLAAIRADKDILLANKEALVAGGPIVNHLLRTHRSRLIPVDSEHCSIYQCLLGRRPEDTIRQIILTASGGPFWRRSIDSLSDVTPAEAVRHPRWSMGKKISVDSATMMNKGLEVIEAAMLFGLDASAIRVLIHPESIVHGMVEFDDGAISALLSTTDMRMPISFALGCLLGDDSPGRRLRNGSPRLDLAALGSLSFYEPDCELFPALTVCYQALRAGGGAPAALNAANEVAVWSFLSEKTPFASIPEIVADVVQSHPWPDELTSFEQVVAVDELARERANQLLGAHAI
ncbi:MAG: 1-deoxy-D-xylulose-5-phosphate reductoisomerase [Bdellovibrionales bacterium]|nr:1-deoxy-D-xylulose-5-phosphate reductoisomerase [Bdellovibrionales bacterium]